MRRLLITGSRAFSDENVIRDTLADRFSPDVRLVSGHADGADKICEAAWEELGGKVERYPADWRKYGRRAGLLRNERMGTLPGIRECAAFHLDNSTGTGHMITVARNNGIEVTVFGHSAEHDDYLAGQLWKAGRLSEAADFVQRCRIRHPESLALWNQRGAQIQSEIERREPQAALFGADRRLRERNHAVSSMKPEPTAADLAAEILGQYMADWTPEESADALSDLKSVEVRYITDPEPDRDLEA